MDAPRPAQIRLTPGERMIWAKIYITELRELEAEAIADHRRVEEQLGKRVIVSPADQRAMADDRRAHAVAAAAEEIGALREFVTGAGGAAYPDAKQIVASMIEIGED